MIKNFYCMSKIYYDVILKAGCIDDFEFGNQN